MSEKPMPDTVEYAFGDTVYHRSEPEKSGIVCQVTFFPGGHFFNIQWGPTSASNHYAFELTRDREFSLT